MMSDTPHLDRCAICGGTREEHNSSVKHMFTTTPGELRPPPATQTQPQRAPDAALVVVSRLIEVLLDKDVITKDEALSCYGIGFAKPEPSGEVDVHEQRVGSTPGPGG